VKFNLQAATFEARYRRAVAPRLMARHWLKYQLRRSRVAYLPALLRSGSRKPLWRIAGEVALLALRWRCLPFHYLRYGLYERGSDIQQLLSYLPETVFYYRLLAKLNHDTVLLDDKLVCKQLLRATGLPQAELLLSGDGDRCVDASGNPFDESAIYSLLTEGEAVVVKPARYSSGGDGVVVLTCLAGILRDHAEQVVSLKQYGAIWGPWLMERFVRQHTNLAALNQQSLNTLRVITTWHPRQGTQVEYCILKLGAGKGLVDNAHDGGLYLGVDKASGELSEVAFDESFMRHSKHPLSGAPFAGYKIEAIREVVALAERAAALFPQTVLVGWDIAIGENGPLIIEGNSSPGLTNVQRTHGGVANTLGRYLAHAYERSQP
jgi:putative polysaccharide biosynthesis protein